MTSATYLFLWNMSHTYLYPCFPISVPIFMTFAPYFWEVYTIFLRSAVEGWKMWHSCLFHWLRSGFCHFRHLLCTGILYWKKCWTETKLFSLARCLIIFPMVSTASETFHPTVFEVFVGRAGRALVSSLLSFHLALSIVVTCHSPLLFLWPCFDSMVLSLLPCLALSYLMLSCVVWSCLVLPYHLLPYLALSHALPCRVV